MYPLSPDFLFCARALAVVFVAATVLPSTGFVARASHPVFAIPVSAGGLISDACVHKANDVLKGLAVVDAALPGDLASFANGFFFVGIPRRKAQPV